MKFIVARRSRNRRATPVSDGRLEVLYDFGVYLLFLKLRVIAL